MANTLAHSPADIIRHLLIDLGVGVLPATPPTVPSEWSVYVSHEPDVPDNCITVFDTVGQDDGRSMVDGELFGHCGFQIRIRARTHGIGWLKADSIQLALSGVLRKYLTIDSIEYMIQAITQIGDVMPIGQEAATTRRRLFTLNATFPVRTCG